MPDWGWRSLSVLWICMEARYGLRIIQKVGACFVWRFKPDSIFPQSHHFVIPHCHCGILCQKAHRHCWIARTVYFSQHCDHCWQKRLHYFVSASANFHSHLFLLTQLLDGFGKSQACSQGTICAEGAIA